MKTLESQLQETISKMSETEFLNLWEELKDFNEIGPIAIDYVDEIQCKLNNKNSNFCSNTNLIKIENEIVFDENSSFFLAA